jgi:hypothetical protein
MGAAIRVATLAIDVRFGQAIKRHDSYVLGFVARLGACYICDA